MKTTIKYLFLATICFLFSCTEDVDDPTKQLGSIAGIVYDKVTTAPVSGVNLKLEPGDKSTVTGSDGTYSFNDLQQGVYTIKLSKDGYKDNPVKMTVAAGIRTEGDIMIERIPATMITDKDTLDFGIDQSLNSLSFSIVNRDYATLYWNIGGLEDWITVDPMSGELASGKTATVIVTINRDSEIIKPGGNNSTIIIRSSSGHGSAEIHIKVTGEVKEDPAVIINDATQVTSSTATLKGIITNPGIPSYWERGFYYSVSSIDPTQLENNPNVIKKTYPVNDTLEYSVKLTGLEINKVYYARSYVINKHKQVLSTNEIEFKTFITKPRISIKEITEKDVSQQRAKLNGNVDFKGDPEYSEKGFIYGQTAYLKNGKIVKVEGSGEGDFNTYIEEIELDKNYNVWAYIIQRSDTIYNDIPASFTLTTTQPSVSVQATNSIDVEKHSAVLNGTVTNVGDPKFTEKGFVYSLSPAPTVNDTKVPVEGIATGSFSVSVTSLELDKTYYVRTYVCHLGKTYYSNETVSFSLATTQPSVSVQAASSIDVEKHSAVLNGTVTNVGNPKFTEKGFVYSLSPAPTVNDTKVPVEGIAAGSFSVSVTNLELDKTYYVRTYVCHLGKTYYSNETVSFSLATTQPSVSVQAASSIDVEKHSTVLNGAVTNVGNPQFTEKGFVYSLSPAPTVDDTKVPVEGIATGSFSVSVTSLELDKTYYVRTYVCQLGKTYYSNETVSFSLATTQSSVSVQAASSVDVEKHSAVLNGTVTNVGNPQFTEKGFVYSLSPAPTVDNTKVPVEGIAYGSFSVSVIGLELNKTYYVRTYICQLGKIYYSNETVSFSPGTTQPSISVQKTTSIDVEKHSAIFNGTVTEIGSPKFTEKGFVYSLSPVPTVDDNKIPVEGISSGDFSVSVTGLEWNKTYYVRTYICQLGNTYYSNETERFSLTVTQPQVSIQQASSVDIQNHSAILNGTVTEKGEPSFTEKGFVYSLSPSPTVNDNKILVEGITSGNYSVSITGLEIDKTYYARAYIRQLDEIYYSTETVKITLSRTTPSIQMRSISELSYSAKEAKVSGTISDAGVPVYSRRGFVYGFESNPTIDNDRSQTVTGTGTGDFSLFLTNLTTERQYFVKAFVEQEEKIYYSTNELNFTLVPEPAQLGTISYSDIDINSAEILCSIINRGDPIYTEKGFVYNINGNPEIDNNTGKILVEGNGSGDFSGRITGLKSNTKYYVRAYVKHNGNTYYSSELSFKTEKQEPIVVTNDATDVLLTNATLNATVSFVGDPVYEKRGFYYGTNSNPTAQNSTVLVENANSQGSYSFDIVGLKERTKYYYRAYVIQSGETNPTISNNVVSFTTGNKPSVTTYDIADVLCTGTENNDLIWSATFQGYYGSGNPSFTSCGFVYGTTDYPTVDDGSSTFVTLPNLSPGTYSTTVSGFKTNVRYRVRAVAVTPLGYYYGESKEFKPAIVAPEIETVSPNNVKFVGDEENKIWSARFLGNITDKGNPEYTTCGFVYGTTDYPSMDDGSSTYVSAMFDYNTGLGGFYATVSNLKNDVHYKIRAVAITTAGYYYGNTIDFTPTITIPSIQTTSTINGISCSGTEEDNLNWTIAISGTVTQRGNPDITSFGFLIGTDNNPTIGDETSTYVPHITTDNTTYITTVPNLKTNVKYYFRAVAETPIGYIYGATFSFTPQVIPPQLSMNEPTIGIRDGVWFFDFSCEIKSRGIPSATKSANDYGFVISQQSNPTIGDGSSTTIQCDNAIIDHDNFYAFRRGLLTANKTYYVRAYTKTILGYTYSDELTFKTY